MSGGRSKRLRRLPKAAADERGSVAILGGAILSLMTAISIVVIDLGSIYLEKRSAQGALDIATQIAAEDLPNAESIVHSVLEKNGIDKIDALTIVLGRYSADPLVDPSRRFVAGAAPPNALRAELRTTARLFFARPLLLDGSVAIGVASIGAQNRTAAISIGSRLLRVEGGVLNAILGPLLGGSIALTAVDYRHLADADVDLFRFLDALALETGVTAGTYDQLLDAAVSSGQVTAAIAAALAPDQSAYAISAAAKLAEATRASSVSVPLSRLIELGPFGSAAIGSRGGGFAVQTSVMSLLSGAATAANGGSQLALDLGATVPGLTSLTVYLDVGEQPQSSPWLSIGSDSVTVRTAQIRAGARASIGGSGLLAGLRIDLPIAVEVAPAEASLVDIACDATRRPTVTVSARPGVANAWLAETVPVHPAGFAKPSPIKPAKIVDLAGLITITGQAHVEIANLSADNLVFDPDAIRLHRAETVSTRDFTGSLAAGLLRDLRLDVRTGPLTLISASVFRARLLEQIAPAMSAIDNLLVSVLQFAGVTLGEADVWVNGANCGRPGLVG